MRKMLLQGQHSNDSAKSPAVQYSTADSFQLEELPKGFLEEPTKFDDFLYPLSQNSSQDVANIEYSAVIPNFIIPRYQQDNIKIENYMPHTQEYIQAYHKKVKDMLNIHYLNRIFAVLNLCGYKFKTRSTNWKNAKFYSQMLCTNDVEAKRRKSVRESSTSTTNTNNNGSTDSTLQVPDFLGEFSDKSIDAVGKKHRSRGNSSQQLYTCHSHLNYSFDTISGHFHIDFGHRNHFKLESVEMVKNSSKQSMVMSVSPGRSKSTSELFFLEDAAKPDTHDLYRDPLAGISFNTPAANSSHQSLNYTQNVSVTNSDSYLRRVLTGTMQKETIKEIEDPNRVGSNGGNNAVAAAAAASANCKMMTPFASALNKLHQSISSSF